MSDLVLSVIASRAVDDVTVGRVLDGVQARLAVALSVEPTTIGLTFGLGALTDFGLTRTLERGSPFVWHDDLEVFELDVLFEGRVAQSISVRHGLLAWDHLLPAPLEASLARVVGAPRAAHAMALDAAWWFDTGLASPVERALAAALACAIAERCDGILVESEEECVFGSVEAFLEAWPTFSAR